MSIKIPPLDCLDEKDLGLSIMKFNTPPNLPEGEAFQSILKSEIKHNVNIEQLADWCEYISPPLEGLGEVKTPAGRQNSSDLSLTEFNTKSNLTEGEVSLVTDQMNEFSRFGYITANPFNYPFIKNMRDVLKDNPTEAEKLLWKFLRNKKTGHKIRRQHIINNFIVDFVCLRKKTIIEIDGKIHLKQKECDDLRTYRLNELGYEVIRFTNEDVFNNPELVTIEIKDYLDNKTDLQSNTGILVIKEGLNSGSMRFKTPPNLPEGEAFQSILKSEIKHNVNIEQLADWCEYISPPLEGLGEVKTPAETNEIINKMQGNGL